MDKNYIFGIRAIIEAIEAGRHIEKILLRKDAKSELLFQLRKLAAEKFIPIQYVPNDKLNAITKKNHQGAIAFVSPVTFWSIDEVISRVYEQGKVPFIFILDKVTDVRNFGAIVRSAECSGVDAIVIPTKNTAKLSGDAMKTSAGALNYVPIVRHDSLGKIVDYLKDAGFQIVAASEKASQYYFDLDFTVPTAVIMGSEEKGISPHLLRKSDFIAKIPIQGKIESLNVSVAAALFMYEAVRQRIK